MTDDPRGDPVPVVADALATHWVRTFSYTDGPLYVCQCGWSGSTRSAYSRHAAKYAVERLYGEGLLAYGVGKREET